jgi:hypothetical protein
MISGRNLKDTDELRTFKGLKNKAKILLIGTAEGAELKEPHMN